GADSSTTTTTTKKTTTPPSGGMPGGGGGSTVIQQTIIQQPETTPIANSTATKVESVSGVASVESTLRRSDTSSKLKTTAVTTPDGKSVTAPLMVNGISSGATHFTLMGGGTPTLVSGRNLQASDASSKVIMM